MADPWDSDLIESDPWDVDPTLEEITPSVTKSEKVGRGLKSFTLHSLYEGPLGVVDAAGSILSNLVGETASGLAGIAGGVAGGIKSGADAALQGIGLMEEDAWQPDGALETAAKWQKGTSEAIGWEPVSKAGEDIGDVAAAGMKKSMQGVKHIGAGYTGLANLALGDEQLAKMSIEEFLQTPDALSELNFEATGNPTWAAVTRLLPDLATVAMPGAKTTRIGKQPRVAPDMPPDGFGGVGDAPSQRPAPDTGPVPESGFERTPDIGLDEFDAIQEALQSGNKQQLFDLMDANPKLVTAFEALGIEFTPGMVAENAALRQVQSGLKSVPGSQLGTYDDAARLKLQDKADELINRQGSTNRMGVDSAVDAEFKGIREGYVKHEDAMWKSLDEAIPRGSPIDLENAANGVMQRVTEAGRNGNVEDGLKNVSRHDQQLFKMTHERVPVERRVQDPTNPDEFIVEKTYEWVYTDPKYAAVDNYRKKLGRGMDGRDDFGGADQGELDFLYGQMAEAQGRVASGNGYGALWKEMNETTVARKELEAAMRRTQGTSAGLIGKVSQASSSLRKGIAGPLRQLMEDVPENQRALVASSILEDMFYPSAIKTGDMKQSFVASYKALKRNPEAMDLIFDHLEEATKSDFIMVGDAAEGFFRSTLKDNFSNTANAAAVIEKIQQGKTMMMLMGIARTGVSRAPVVGSAIAREGGEGIKAAYKARARKAADFLQSDDLRQAIIGYAKGGAEEAKRILNGSKAYNQWYEYLSEAEKKQITAAGGLIGWMTTEENEE